MKLTDSQLVILSAAAQHKAGLAFPLPKSVKLNKGSVARVMGGLLKRKLVSERNATRQEESWREAKNGDRFTLVITPAGQEAIGVETKNQKAAEPKSPQQKKAAKVLGRADKPTVREGTKLAALIALLKRKNGATIEEAVKATGWQAHSVRGAISGALKKKLGLEVDSSREDRGRVYRIVHRS
jgi:hypothetical protein